MWDMLLEPIRKPEYLHILLNPVPTHGVPLGAAALALALWMRSRQARAIALFVILLSAACAWPVYSFGERAYDRIAARTDDAGQAWLDEHSHRAEKVVPCFYVLAGVALLAIVLPRSRPRAENPLAAGTLALSLALTAAGGYVAYAGGRVDHQELRTGPPPGSSVPVAAAPTAPSGRPAVVAR